MTVFWTVGATLNGIGPATALEWKATAPVAASTETKDETTLVIERSMVGEIDDRTYHGSPSSGSKYHLPFPSMPPAVKPPSTASTCPVT
jgi:hypothetical protein